MVFTQNPLENIDLLVLSEALTDMRDTYDFLLSIPHGDIKAECDLLKKRKSTNDLLFQILSASSESHPGD